MAIALIVASGCGQEDGDAVSSQSDPAATSTPPPGVIKQDRGGTLRVPATAKRTSFEHTDPYFWKAELSFTGDMLEVVQELKNSLVAQGFTFEPHDHDPAALCRRGAILEDDGTGRCSIVGYEAGGGGNIIIDATRDNAKEPGTVKIHRTYGHRMPNDGDGPPYPEPMNTPPDGEGLERDAPNPG